MISAAITFERRQEQLRSIMTREHLPVVLVYGPSSYLGPATNTQGYVRYLTGWTARFGPSMVLLPAHGSLTLVVPGAHEAAYVAEAFPWIKECVPESPGNYGLLARKMLEALTPERVGLVGLAEMPQPVHESLTGGDPALDFVQANHLLDTMRSVKSPDEIEYHRQAARVSDTMLRTFFSRLQSHRGPAWKLMVEMESAGRSLCAESIYWWLACGQPADRPRNQLASNLREVRDGDQIVVGTYVSVEGYWGQCIRMGSLGPPSPEYRRLYDAALAQHRTAAQEIREGRDARRIQTQADRIAEELVPGSSGYAGRFRHAHFTGLDYAEGPSSSVFPDPATWSQMAPPPTRQVILRPGMVLELHPNLGLAGIGLGCIGDQYVVKEDGPERLTNFPQDLVVV